MKKWYELAMPSDRMMLFMPAFYVMYKQGIISEEEYNGICEKIYDTSSVIDVFTKLDEIIKPPTQ